MAAGVTPADIGSFMRLGPKYIAPLLAAGAVAVAVAAAPIATAAPTASHDASQVQQSCADLGATHSECQPPGNVEVYDAPPQLIIYAGGGT